MECHAYRSKEMSMILNVGRWGLPINFFCFKLVMFSYINTTEDSSCSRSDSSSSTLTHEESAYDDLSPERSVPEKTSNNLDSFMSPTEETTAGARGIYYIHLALFCVCKKKWPWAELLFIIEPTCAKIAQWAHMCRCLPACLPVRTWPKVGENNSYLRKYSSWEPETLPQYTLFIGQFVKNMYYCNRAFWLIINPDPQSQFYPKPIPILSQSSSQFNPILIPIR